MPTKGGSGAKRGSILSLLLLVIRSIRSVSLARQHHLGPQPLQTVHGTAVCLQVYDAAVWACNRGSYSQRYARADSTTCNRGRRRLEQRCF